MISREKILEWLKGLKYITVDEKSTVMTEEFEKEHQVELQTNLTINKVINYVNNYDDYDLTKELKSSFDKFIVQVKREEILTETKIHDVLSKKFEMLMREPLSNQYVIKRFMYMVTETYSVMTKYMDCDIVEYSAAYILLMRNLKLLYEASNKTEL